MCQGLTGASDTLAAVLFYIDYALTMVQAGVDGMNFHDSWCSAYSAIVFPSVRDVAPDPSVGGISPSPIMASQTEFRSESHLTPPLPRFAPFSSVSPSEPPWAPAGISVASRMSPPRYGPHSMAYCSHRWLSQAFPISCWCDQECGVALAGNDNALTIDLRLTGCSNGKT